MKDLYRQHLVTVILFMLFVLPSGEVNAEVEKDFGVWGAIQGQGSFILTPGIPGNGNGGWKARAVFSRMLVGWSKA